LRPSVPQDGGVGRPAPNLDDKLRHVADKKIALDLDDGVKVNYGKFGNLLAEVKPLPAGTTTLEPRRKA